MIVLQFLIFLNIMPTWATTFTFTDAVIDISSLTQDSLLYGGTTDNCKKIIVRNSQVHHLSANGVYQSWWKGGFSPYFSVKNITNYGRSEFGISQSGLTAIFFYEDLNGSKIAVTKFNANYSETSTTTFISVPLDSIFAADSNFSYCFWTQNSTGKTTIYTFDPTNGSQINKISFSNVKITMTPDLQKILAWNSQNYLTIFKFPSMAYSGYYNSQVSPTQDVTSKITFSQDSSLTIIETDQFNPLIVLNMTTYKPIAQISISQNIKEAHFLDSTNSIIVVFGSQSTIFVDLINNNSQYQTPLLNGTIFATDQSNNIFTCYQNIISQQNIRFTRGAFTSQPTNIDQKENQFFATYELNSAQAVTLSKLNQSLSIPLQIVSLVYTFVTSTPLIIFFLGFFNFFSLSNLYVLLNFPIPEHIYNLLVFILMKFNINVLELLGINIDLTTLTSEKVDSYRALFFEVSSDVMSSNAYGFTFFIFNIFIIIMLRWICKKIFWKESIIRRFMKKEKISMIYGQIISMLTPLTLPWIFLFLNGGTIDVKTKINFAFFSLLFFICLIFPFLYLFGLISKRKMKMIKLSKPLQQVNKKVQKINLPKTVNRKKIQSENKTNHHVSKGFSKNRQLNNSVQAHTQNILEKRIQAQKRTNNNRQATANKKTINFEENANSHPIQNVLKELKKSNLQNKFKYTKKQGEIEKRQKRGKLTKNYVEKTRTSSMQKRQRYNLWQLLTAQIVQQWYLCEANCLLPALVLFSEPAYFLVPIFFFLALGVAINFKKKEHRLNCLIMSLYPFLFHLSFMIFYWCSSNEIVVITEICCLLVYFLGLIHNFLFLLYETIHFFYVAIKKCCYSSKVCPSSTSTHYQTHKNVQSNLISVNQKTIQKDDQVTNLPKRKIKTTFKMKSHLRIKFNDQNQ